MCNDRNNFHFVLKDMDALTAACRKTAVRGAHFSVRKVSESGAVIVLNPNPETSTDTFQYFFRNERRSGGSKDAKVERDKDNNFLIVHFGSKEG
jgi:hypothetical protein